MTQRATRPSTAGPKRAAIYSRISSDREGNAEGVIDQEKKCHALAEQLGYEVVEVFRDNDISASTKSKKARPRYDDMFKLARAGGIDAIVAYSNSRLTRRPREFEDLIDLHDDYGVLIRTVVSGDADLTTADGRRMARFLAGESTAEAERISERVKAQKERAADAGVFRGGRRPFGFEADGVTIREKEAEVIREATDAVLAGRSLRAISAEIRANGVKGTMGRPFTNANLRDLLIRPRNAGLIARGLPGRKALASGHNYDYEIIGAAAWDAIVPREKWDSLVAKLMEPHRMTNTLTESVWVGSGLYRCGAAKVEKQTGPDGLPVKTEKGRFVLVPVLDPSGEPVACGGVMRPVAYAIETDERGKPLKDAKGDNVRRYRYSCSDTAHLSIRADKVDDYVLGEAAEMVRDPRVRARLHPADIDTSEDVAEQERLRRKIKKYLRDYQDEFLEPHEFKELRDKANADIAALQDKINRAYAESTAAQILQADDPGQALLDAPIDLKRGALRMLMQVWILPTPEGARVQKWPTDPDAARAYAQTRLRIIPTEVSTAA